MTLGLLLTKLYRPSARINGVRRPRLSAHLDRGLNDGKRLILVSAPAGYGKTTLLAEWLASQTSPAAWLSLDELDNNVTSFWMYVLAALRTVTNEAFGESVQRILDTSPTSPTHTILTALLNEINTLPSKIVLVLDDYHVISNPLIHKGIAFLLDHQPPQLCLVVATRADPPLQISRLRAHEQLTELRAADLQFTPDETSSFLNQTMGLTLTPDDVDALRARTEGWIVGLQLAALSMQGRSDARTRIEEFSGSHHYILEYLVDQVLQRQSQSVQRFLVETCFLTRMCASLCDRVTARADSETVLADLDHRNLFITPLDNAHHWFRYHHLFSELLNAHLLRSEPNVLPVLHQRAAEWYEENGFAGEAVHHALAARDYGMASRMIVNNWRRLFHQGWVNATLQWLESLPPHLVSRLPPLAVAYCWTLFARGDYGRIAPYLEQATLSFEQLTASGTLPQDQVEYRIIAQQLALLQAVIARSKGDIAAAMSRVDHVLTENPSLSQELGPRIGSLAYGASYLQMGHNYVAAGDLDQAAACFLKSSAACKTAGNIYGMAGAVFELARVWQRQGRLPEAEAICRETLAESAQSDYADWPALCFIHIAMADLLCESKRLGDASQHLQRGLDLCLRSGQVLPLVLCYLASVRLHHVLGDASAALAAWQNAQKLAGTIENPDLNKAVTLAAREAKLPVSSRSCQQLGAPVLVEPLSERERQVLRLICAGKSNQEIADELVIALDTVKRHANNIYSKLSVKRRAQAIARARELDLM